MNVTTMTIITTFLAVITLLLTVTTIFPFIVVTAVIICVTLAYSHPYVDRIWLWAYYNKIPIYPIFYLLKGNYNPNIYSIVI